MRYSWRTWFNLFAVVPSHSTTIVVEIDCVSDLRPFGSRDRVFTGIAGNTKLMKEWLKINSRLQTHPKVFK